MSKWKRKSNRLGGYDYAHAGYYFVTICTKNRKNIFGEIMNNEISVGVNGNENTNDKKFVEIMERRSILNR
jgi:hypothetical protein